MSIRLAWLGFLILLASAATHTPASANCTLPYQLTNGTTADASQVMGDLNTIIGCLGSTAAGFVNKFRNGTMDVWQRSTSGTATTTAGAAAQTGADGWYIVPAGASVAWAQATGRGPTVFSLKVTGASSVTDVVVKQRIESYVAAPLSGQTVTVQAEVFNSTGSAIVPTLTVKHAGSADNWSSPTTDVNAVSLQSIANGSWTQVAYTFTASTSSVNGLEISFDFLNNFGAGSQSIQITELDIRGTPGVATGINNGPPPPELRPVFVELSFCQRYYWQTTSTFNPVGYGGGNYFTYVSFPATMRAAPTAANFSYGDSSNVSSSSVYATSISNMTIIMTAGSSAVAYEIIAAGITLTAEL